MIYLPVLFSLTIHYLFAVCQVIVDTLILPDKMAGVKGF